jgi:hypothetical protein
MSDQAPILPTPHYDKLTALVNNPRLPARDLDPRTKAILHAEALAAHTSMGALVRQWIEERLEL